MRKIYLACPYSTRIPFLKWWRFRQVNKKAGQLMEMGFIVFSPISHSHPIASQCGLPKDFEYWKKFDESFIKWADEVWILTLWGWRKSKGIKQEIAEAEQLGKEVVYSG